MRAVSVAVLATVAAIIGSSGVAVAAPKDYCADLKGGNTGTSCVIALSDPAYSVNISIPLDYPDQKSVADYVSQTRDAFLNAAKSGAQGTTPNSLTMTPTEYTSSVPRAARRPWYSRWSRTSAAPTADDVQGVQLGPELSQGDPLHGRTGRQAEYAVVAGGRSAEDRGAARPGWTAGAAGTTASGRASYADPATGTAGCGHDDPHVDHPPPPPPRRCRSRRPRCSTPPTIRISRWSTTG